MQQQRESIQKITNNPDSATFENTILPFEDSGRLLDRVSRVFFALVEADKTPEIAEIEKQVQPLLTNLENEISFNQALFQRIRQVYDREHDALTGEDQKLLEEIYKDFVRRGALLPEDKMERMKAINRRISDLQQQWGNDLPDATNDAVAWVQTADELAGLSEADIAQCAKDAENLGSKAPYAIVIVNTTQQALLTNLDNRELRRRIFEASVHRADGTNKHNTFPLACEIAKLRAEQAELMGYENYASYSLEKTMAVSNLRKAADVLTRVNHNTALAAECTSLANEVEAALKQYAVKDHPKYGKIYAFEVDGFGNQLCMDDANVPSLLAMAYLGDVPIDDPIYQNTRRFVWSEDNPYFYKGAAGEGIGGPHVGYDMVWPMSIMMRAFTSTDDAEIRECLQMLVDTDAGTGFIHESFNKNNATKYTRSWFAWQNTLFGELILKLLADGKKDLLNSMQKSKS